MYAPAHPHTQRQIVGKRTFSFFPPARPQSLHTLLTGDGAARLLLQVAESVDWPSADTVASAMLAFKARGETQVDSVASAPSSLAPAGYFQDIESAMYMSLLDDVFRLPGDLYGRRKADLTLWVRTLASTYPAATMRERLRALATQLQTQDTWAPDEYREMLRKWGAVEPAQTDALAWSWCAPSAGGTWGSHTHTHIISLSRLSVCVSPFGTVGYGPRDTLKPLAFFSEHVNNALKSCLPEKTALLFTLLIIAHVPGDPCLMSTGIRTPVDDVMRPSCRAGVKSGFRSRPETDRLGGVLQATAGTPAGCGCCSTPCWPTRMAARPAPCSAPCTCG